MASKPFGFSAKVVILDDRERCLLLKRSLKSKGNPGKWDFPGGKIEAGENIDQGLLREVMEETGLAISLQHVLGAAESDLPDRKVVYLIMEGRAESGTVRLSQEHEGFLWIERRALPEADLADQFRSFAATYAQDHRT